MATVLFRVIIKSFSISYVNLQHTLQLVTDKSDIRIKHFAHINVAITAMKIADIVKETDVTHYTHFLSQNYIIALYAADKFGDISQSMWFAHAQKLRKKFVIADYLIM